MPSEYAIAKVHNFLKEEGVRDAVTLIASGGIRTAHDMVKAICLGADGISIGTAELVALECVRCGNFESGRGCARGIATTDSALADLYGEEWATQRLTNMYHAWRVQLVEILQRFGLKSVRDLVGRTDLLEHMDYNSGANDHAL
jgi:glutamate synthase domain-containing protein 2